MTRSQGSDNLVEPLIRHRRTRRTPKKSKRNQRMAANANHIGEPEGPPPAGNFPPAAGEGAANGGERRRTLRDYDTPSSHRNRGGIQHPAIDRQEFEIKPGLLALVKQNQFHGLPSENPMYHLDTFEDICATTRVQGVPDEVIKCRLFTFSLCDKAHRWLKSLDPGTIQTWDQCKTAFLEQYFTQSRTSQLRNKISSFRQSGTESFGEAWERYKEYFRECPHHGFNQSCLLNTFYRGIDERYKMALDAASNGNFATNTEEEALIKIENLASSDNNHATDYDRSARTSPTDSRRMDELIAKMEQLVKKGSRSVSFCEQKDEDEEEVFQAELSYINGQQPFNRGFNNNYRNNNLSYRSNNVENPQDQYYPPRQANQGYQQPFQQRQNSYGQGFQQRQQQTNGGLPRTNLNQQHPSQEVTGSQVAELKSMLDNFAKNTTEEMAKLREDLTNWNDDLTSKIEAARAHIRNVETQAKQTPPPQDVPESSKRHGKGICNFVEDNDLAAEDFELSIDDVTWEEIDEILQIMDEHEQGKAKSRSETSKETREDVSITPETDHWEEAMSVEVESNADRESQAGILSDGSSTGNLPMEPYEILAVLKREIGDDEISADLKSYSQEIVDLMFGQKNVKETAKAIVTSHKMKIARLTARKTKDPGKFTIPASIKETSFEGGICDLGSSISITSEKVCKHLRLPIDTSLRTEVTLADGSSKMSIGTAKDTIVQVGKIRIPTDFVVLRYKEEPPDNFILGRPFLKSGGALIDTLNDTIKFRVGTETVTFDMKKERERKKKKAAIGNRAKDPPDPSTLESQHTKEAAPIPYEPP